MSSRERVGVSHLRRWGAAPLPCAAALLLVCGSPPAPVPRGGLGDWARGPVRWLLLPEERRELRRIDSNARAVAFIEEFWRRRDPDPDRAGNPFAEAFYDRVEAADRLYAEAGVRGSLTDRGRALILLGAPNGLRLAQRPALRWDPRSGPRHRAVTRLQEVEVWGYRREDLPAGLQEALGEQGAAAGASLVFSVEGRRTVLVRGEEILDLAARAAVRR